MAGLLPGPAQIFPWWSTPPVGIIYAYYSNFEQLNQLDLNFCPTTSNFSEILKLSKPMYLSVNYIEKAVGIL